MLNCPRCKSTDIVKNGYIHNRKQNHKCKACGRLSWCAIPCCGNLSGITPQFAEQAQQKIISQQTKDMIDKLLLEKIPLADITRVCDLSESWLQTYVNRKYESVPRPVNISSKKRKTDNSV